MTGLRLSPWAISQFKTCPRLFYYAVVENRRVPPAGATHMGKAFHKSAEGHNRFKLKTRKDLPRDELHDHFTEAWLEEPESEIRWEGETPTRLYDDGHKLVDLFAVTSAPRIQPELIEHKVAMPITSEITLSGRLDLVDDKQTIHDYKTAAKRPQADAAEDSDQVTDYEILFRHALQRPSSGFVLQHFVRPNKSHPLGFFEAQQSERTSAQLDIRRGDILAVASQAAHAMSTGLFPYAPADSWKCSAKWCGFYEICPGGRARRSRLVPMEGFGFEEFVAASEAPAETARPIGLTAGPSQDVRGVSDGATNLTVLQGGKE